MNAMSVIPINKKPAKKEWLVCLVDQTRLFITAEDVHQDETSLVFFNSNGPNRDLVIQVEKIGMMWFMPNIESKDSVMIQDPPAEEEDDGSEK